MRRLMGVASLIVLGLFLGFIARLVWPRTTARGYLTDTEQQRYLGAQNLVTAAANPWAVAS